ncbi:MAG: Uma2 family endonuclease [Planctomycetes bacterium]|nr:Uma2 family endonuclease [Planctomycetota bacterium]
MASTTQLTYDDYLRLPDDGRRYEILDGELFVSPAPMTRHQRWILRLSARLLEVLESNGVGIVLVAPTDVEMGPHDIVQPDLAVVRAERRSILHDTRIIGAPDLVVEVLSKSTARIDLGKKSARYAHAGVVEYWIVDPETRRVERRTDPRGDRYESIETFSERVTSQVFPELRFDIDELWPTDM